MHLGGSKENSEPVQLRSKVGHSRLRLLLWVRSCQKGLRPDRGKGQQSKRRPSPDGNSDRNTLTNAACSVWLKQCLLPALAVSCTASCLEAVGIRAPRWACSLIHLHARQVSERVRLLGMISTPPTEGEKLELGQSINMGGKGSQSAQGLLTYAFASAGRP